MLRAGGKTAHHGRYLFFFTLAGLLAFAEEAWAKDVLTHEVDNAAKPTSLNVVVPRVSFNDPAKDDIRKNLLSNRSPSRAVFAKPSTHLIRQSTDVEFTTAMRRLARMPLNDENKKSPLSLGIQGRYLRFSIGW